MSVQAITELMNLTPPSAVLVTRDSRGRTLSEEEVPTALIQCGDLLKVLPHMSLPANESRLSNLTKVQSHGILLLICGVCALIAMDKVSNVVEKHT